MSFTVSEESQVEQSQWIVTGHGPENKWYDTTLIFILPSPHPSPPLPTPPFFKGRGEGPPPFGH